MTPNEWRKKHRKCGTCAYWGGYVGLYPKTCKVKLTHKSAKSGRFCKIYKEEPQKSNCNCAEMVGLTPTKDISNRFLGKVPKCSSCQKWLSKYLPI